MAYFKQPLQSASQRPKNPLVFVRLAACTLVGASLLLGCTEDEPQPPVEPNKIFGDPSSLDRSLCTPGALTGLDPTGIWHFDNHGPGIAFPSVIRYDQANNALSARMDGREAPEVQFSADNLFSRVEYTLAPGDVRVRAYNACGIDAEGNLVGAFGRCQKGKCYTGTFKAVRIQRIASEVESQGIEKISEWGGDPAAPWGEGTTVNVRVKDGIAYLARFEDGLRIVDVTDPASPFDVGASPVVLTDNHELYNDVKLVDGIDGKRYALMASNRRGIVVIDVSNPASPKEVSMFPAPPSGEEVVNVHTLFTEVIDTKTFAYLANITTLGLDVFDVTDPRTPLLLGSYVHHPGMQALHYDHDASVYLHDLYVEQGRAYLDYWGAGLVVVDTQPDPSNITLLAQFDAYDRRTNHSNWVTTLPTGKFAVMGDEDFGAHVRIVNVDQASAGVLQVVGEFSLRPEVSVHNIMALGDKAYVAYYQDGFRILDISTPTAPKLQGYFNTWDGRDGSSFYEGAIGVDVDLATGRIYVADTERGLFVFQETP